jgi:hypothetical protein
MGDGAHAFPIVLPQLPVNAQVEGDFIERDMTISGKLPFCQDRADCLREFVNCAGRRIEAWFFGLCGRP